MDPCFLLPGPLPFGLPHLSFHTQGASCALLSCWEQPLAMHMGGGEGALCQGGSG